MTDDMKRAWAFHLYFKQLRNQIDFSNIPQASAQDSSTSEFFSQVEGFNDPVLNVDDYVPDPEIDAAMEKIKQEAAKEVINSKYYILKLSDDKKSVSEIVDSETKEDQCVKQMREVTALWKSNSPPGPMLAALKRLRAIAYIKARYAPTTLPKIEYNPNPNKAEVYESEVNKHMAVVMAGEDITDHDFRVSVDMACFLLEGHPELNAAPAFVENATSASA